ncbi:hypothetical protein JKY72_05540 [Candidatus Gracilibacteria bacterium]|nr:hypothetical protein [Candidatus Gracilibacteria bacterium]
MSTAEKSYNLDRKVAARLLKVSIRTLDRYVRSKKLSTQLVDGRIWLDKSEVKRLIHGKSRPPDVDMSTLNLSTPVYVDKVDNIDKIELVNSDKVDSSELETLFKKMLDEMKIEIKEQQGRLEIANYRVGQLEAQLKNSIPMLEYRQESYEREQREDQLSKKITETSGLLKKISIRLQDERIKKRVFLLALLFLLALQPLWLIIFNS